MASRRPWRTGALLAAAVVLTGCERGREAAELTPEELTHLKLKRYDADHGRPVGPAIREFGSEEGSGEVVAVDPVALTVSLRHRQATGEDWPGMVMTFRIRRTLIPTLKPGQRVYFRAVVLDGAGEILDLRPANP